MNTRTLPRDEWHRLPIASGMHAFLEYAIPDDVQIVVIEDGDQIVACWSALRITHLEGAWIDPLYRGRTSVARKLLRATFTAARTWASKFAMTGAQSDDVRDLLTTHLRAQRIHMDTYVVPLEGPTCP